jgi:hypothetical protein
VIQAIVERTGTEITAHDIGSTFASTYLEPGERLALVDDPVITMDAGESVIDATVRLDGRETRMHGRGGSATEALVDALGRGCDVGEDVLDAQRAGDR